MMEIKRYVSFESILIVFLVLGGIFWSTINFKFESTFRIILAIFLVLISFQTIISRSRINKSELPLVERSIEVENDESENVLVFDNYDSVDVSSHFRDTVKQVLIYDKDISESKAERLIREGEWTDDSIAAAYIDSDCHYPLIERIISWLQDTPRTEYRTSRASKAIKELYAGEEI